MRCTVCGSTLGRIISDLPFKTANHTIVIVKGLPVFQCVNCVEYLVEDPVLNRIDEILAAVHGAPELEVIGYAV